MTVEVVRGDDGRWLVRGELTFATVSEALARSRALIGGEGELKVDLAGVARADSAGIALLLEWMRMAAAHGQTVGFYGTPGQMMAIARVSDLEAVLPLRSAG